VVPSEVIDIPSDCQDVLSGLAIPTTGSDSSNIIWLGVVLVGLGAVLLTTRRVATVRTR
jgi:LPXTG-motif cell wall-anchored protein